jgi:ketosteroid isomerase-like protein
MSQENVERAYRAYDALRRRDIEAFLTFIDTDVECVPLLMEPEGASYHGHDGIRRWLDEVFSVFPGFSAEIEHVRDLGDVIIITARVQGASVATFPSNRPSTVCQTEAFARAVARLPPVLRTDS